MVSLSKRLMILILSFILIILILQPITVLAEKSLVFDDAMLFTEDEIIKLQTEVNNLSNDYNMDIVIVTTSDTDGKTSREYADDFFDYGGFGVGDNYDGILFLIDMDNREAYISTFGIGIRYLTDARIERILDIVFDSGLVEDDYYGAAMGFLRGTKDYLEAGIPSNQYNEPEYIKPKNILTFTDVIISIIGGIVTSSLFYFTTKSRYKTPRVVNPFSYRNNSLVKLTLNEDKLVDTFVTHRIIPKPTNNSNSSSGKSTTHNSSSGRSHGGGGRKF
ncbi:TPM domain-containing protein [Tissierella carlieri]|uniref:TPM domain-containing protein n=1 Tax=Tissierella carlieri TaxID=689904 RepID=A0ABT1S627_9FIRM|nr:TPM domain-containing protein [Tissierella carlieri]MCQ4921919.1 TPM domain-containing protein [Tissierella carlieri]